MKRKIVGLALLLFFIAAGAGSLTSAAPEEGQPPSGEDRLPPGYELDLEETEEPVENDEWLLPDEKDNWEYQLEENDEIVGAFARDTNPF